MGFKRDLVTLCEQAGVGTHNVNIFTGNTVVTAVAGVWRSVDVDYRDRRNRPERTNTTRVAGGSVEKVTLPAYERPSAIIITRATSPAAAYAMSRAAYLAVGGFRNGFINSGWYREITPDQEPSDTGLADRGESRYTFNVSAIKRPS
jgi:hypothetical protein